MGRMSESDKARKQQDALREMHDKGVIQLGTFTPVHPGGAEEAIRIMQQNQGSVRDQSQEEIGRGREQMTKRAEESKAHAEELKDRRKKG